MTRTYGVREFAALAGVTVKALHHYDRLGVLKPGRTDAGYRLYSQRDLTRLKQIRALRFLGLPLKQIKILLDAGSDSLGEALQRQRDVLTEKRRQLDRAIKAIDDAERRADSCSAANVLARLIDVIGVESDLDAMQRYFSPEAWAKCRQYYEQWPSQAWRDLYRDVSAALGENPHGKTAQALAARWIALVEHDANGDAAIRAGFWRAWVDRKNWPADLQQHLVAFKIDELSTFMQEAIWEFAERQRQRAGESRPPDRVHPARLALFHKINASLEEDPSGSRARPLVAQWNDMLDREVGGDAETKAERRNALANRTNWPAGFRQYMASLYNTDWNSWEHVTRFVEQINQLKDDPGRTRAD
ncbi:MAG TPA: MerR family transcriptional regulator [Vicinamibacterales bacterium]